MRYPCQITQIPFMRLFFSIFNVGLSTLVRALRTKSILGCRPPVKWCGPKASANPAAAAVAAPPVCQQTYSDGH